MAILSIDEVFVAEGDLYEISSEDGPKVVYDYFVDVEASDGNRYRHYYNYKNDYSLASRICDKVHGFGFIDLEHWFRLSRRPSYALGEVDEVSLMDDEERFHKGL